MSVLKLSHVPIIIPGMSGVIVGRNSMNVINVVKPLHVKDIFKSMKEFILERNLTNVMNVTNALPENHILVFIR